MNDNEKEYFDKELKSHNDPIEGWSTKRLKKEAEGGNDQGQDQSLVIDDIGIE